jgi:hypothetical protein
VTAPESQPNPPTRTLAELPFDAREERVIDTTARWMGTLGRFQILSGGLLLLLCVSVGVAWTFSAVTAAEVETDTTPPLVTLGEVSNTQMGIAMSLVALFAIIILRGGVLFNDAADDLEHHIHSSEKDALHLEDAVSALGRALWLDTIIAFVVAALLVWLGTLA